MIISLWGAAFSEGFCPGGWGGGGAFVLFPNMIYMFVIPGRQKISNAL